MDAKIPPHICQYTQEHRWPSALSDGRSHPSKRAVLAALCVQAALALGLFDTSARILPGPADPPTVEMAFVPPPEPPPPAPASPAPATLPEPIQPADAVPPPQPPAPDPSPPLQSLETATPQPTTSEAPLTPVAPEAAAASAPEAVAETSPSAEPPMPAIADTPQELPAAPPAPPVPVPAPPHAVTAAKPRVTPRAHAVSPPVAKPSEAPDVAAPVVAQAAPSPHAAEVPSQAAASPPAPSPAEQAAADALRGRIHDAVQAAVRYPAAARMMGLAGHARIAFAWRDGAVVGPARIMQSAGASILDDAALAAVRDAHYPPAPPGVQHALLSLLIWVEFHAI